MVPIPSEAAQAFLAKLKGINLHADTCARGTKGDCVLMLDGTMYVVQLQDGTTIKLTDTTGVNGVQSENPALSAWIQAVIQAAKELQPAGKSN